MTCDQLFQLSFYAASASQKNIIGELAAINAEIESQIAQIADAQNMSVEKLYQTVAKEGVNKDTLHKTIAENIAIEKTTAQYMADVKITDSEVQQFMAQNNFPNELPQYNISHILIKTDAKKGDDAVRKQLLNIRGKLSQGVRFEDLAHQYSQDASSMNGGNIGWIGQGMSSPAFDSVLANMQKDEVSQPVKSEFGWHLIKLNDRRMAQLTQEQRVNMAKAIISQQKAPMAYQGWLQQMRSSAYIDFRKKPY